MLLSLYRSWLTDRDEKTRLTFSGDAHTTLRALEKAIENHVSQTSALSAAEEIALINAEIRASLLKFLTDSFAKIAAETPEYELLTSIFEQSSWRSGHRAFREIWGNHTSTFAGLDETEFFLRAQPLYRPLSKHSSPWIIKRVTATEISLLLNSCPHRQPPVSQFSKPECDQLCYFYSFWIRGFLYGLKPTAYFDYQPMKQLPKHFNPDKRCQLTWSIKAIEPQLTA